MLLTNTLKDIFLLIKHSIYFFVIFGSYIIYTWWLQQHETCSRILEYFLNTKYKRSKYRALCWIYIYIYIYGIRSWRIIWSSYRKLAWLYIYNHLVQRKRSSKYQNAEIIHDTVSISYLTWLEREFRYTLYNINLNQPFSSLPPLGIFCFITFK